MAEPISKFAQIDPAADCGSGLKAGPGVVVEAGVRLGAGVELAAGAVVCGGAELGDRVLVGANSVIHAGVRIGADVVVEDCVVLGKRPRLRAGSSAAQVQLDDLVIGDAATICAGAVLYAGATIGEGAIIGDQAQIREGSSVGERSVVGRASCVDFNARVGDRVSIQTGVYVTANAVVEDEVFLGPGVYMFNDDTMGRHPRGYELAGPIVRRAARVGGGTLLVPGVEVGEEAFIGAGAVVTKDVPARGAVLGVPARQYRTVADEESYERWH